MTIKQRLFVKYYLEYGNATEAVMRAYNTKKRNVAAQVGFENLRKPEMKAVVEEQLKLANPNPSDIAKAFTDVLINGTARQKLDASITYFKIMGLLS